MSLGWLWPQPGSGGCVGSCCPSGWEDLGVSRPWSVASWKEQEVSERSCSLPTHTQTLKPECWHLPSARQR